MTRTIFLLSPTSYGGRRAAFSDESERHLCSRCAAPEGLSLGEAFI
jgi:hypothetical protein